MATPEEEAEQQRKALSASSAATFAPQSAAGAPPASVSGVGAELTPEQVAKRAADAAALRESQQRAAGATERAQPAYSNTTVGPYAQQSADLRNAAIDESRGVADRAQANTQASQVNNTTQSTANFQLNGQQTAARQDADTALAAAKAYREQIVNQAKGGIPNLAQLADADQRIAAATRSQDVADINAQAANGGVQRIDQKANAGGIAGFFGQTKDQSNFTAGTVTNPNAVANRGNVDALTASVGGQNFDAQAARAQAAEAGSARSQAAKIDGTQQNQFRQGQVGLANLLTESANGQGPSAAQAQLQAGTDASINSALALARSARGGNASVAMKNALMQNGQTMQAAVTQAAQLRAQEQQQARGQLASVLDTSRGADVGLATSQAGLTQQTALANAANQQQTALANADAQTRVALANSANQQQTNLANQAAAFDKNKLLSQLLAQGATMDQAQQEVQIKQAQFNAELLARQEAARNGQNLAAGQQQASAVGTGIAAAGTILASAASDKRAKKNVEDGEAETRAFLKALSKPKGFEYKDPESFGEGHHIGIMAQDLEKGAPEIVFDDTDGVKKLDMRKALSASLASLGNLDKRLGKVERKRG